MSDRKRTVGDLLEVTEDVPCATCGSPDFEDGDDIVACDACNDAYHLSCLQVAAAPKGSWYCPGCVPTFGGKGVERHPTYAAARRSRLRRDREREAAGLGSGGLPTLDELEALKKAGLAASTRRRIETVERQFERLTECLQLPRSSPLAFGMFVTWRVKEGIAESTIASEMSILQHLPGVVAPPEQEIDRLRNAVKRLAEVPAAAKDPVTLAEIKSLQTATLGAAWRDDGTEDSHRRLRDWTFIYVAFVGMFRSGELLSLRWDQVAITWEGAGSSKELDVGERGPGRPAYVTFYLSTTKTKLDGAAVRVQAKGDDSTECPAWLLGTLRRLARGEHVFENSRRGDVPGALQYDTMRNAFRHRLRDAGLDEIRISRLGLHSLRRGGASAAAANGASMREIMAQGRWRSDVAYIYALVSDERAQKLTGKLIEGIGKLAKGHSELHT